MKLSLIWLIIASVAVGFGAGLFATHWFAQPSAVVVQFGDPSNRADVRVYVSGAVQQPGVYHLHAGDRVVDAVQAAGGPANDANTDAVDFAKRVQDEQSIHIPRVGETIAPPTRVAATPTRARATRQ